MSLPRFVSASAVVLLGWLAVTFVHRVPSQRYPRLDKATVDASQTTGKPAIQGIREVSFSP